MSSGEAVGAEARRRSESTSQASCGGPDATFLGSKQASKQAGKYAKEPRDLRTSETMPSCQPTQSPGG